jgi:pyridinium-3,5-biscarboxylic acid mononucleotide synthase
LVCWSTDVATLEGELSMSEEESLLALFRAVAEGRCGPEDALVAHQRAAVEAGLEQAGVRADLGRARRLGFPEVVYAEGKSDDDLLEAVSVLRRAHDRVLVTRLDEAGREGLKSAGHEGRWNPLGRVLAVGPDPEPRGGRVGVLAAGSADRPAAEEAAATAEAWGFEVRRLLDVGVSGLHRLVGVWDEVESCDLLIVAAGMEGALPSVVGGLFAGPLIALPTSVGYGVGAGGFAALVAQLSSCAPGVLVVNIDNGFGAGYAAGRILASGPAAAATRSSLSPPAEDQNRPDDEAP